MNPALLLPWVAATTSGVMMALSFEPWNLSALAWFAWIPLLSQLMRSTDNQARPRPTPFSLGWLAGVTFWLISIFWIRHVSWLGMMGLSMFLALYFAIWSHFVAAARTRWPDIRGLTHVGIALLSASSWVVLEWFRGWVLGGFPWNTAAVSQVRNIALIQIVSWTGTHGLSFVILFFNTALWLAWCRMRHERFGSRTWRYEFSLALFLVVSLSLTGIRILLLRQPSPHARTLKVALIQPNIPQDVKFEALSLSRQLQRLEDLTRQAAVFHPDLILWPETALVDPPTTHTTIQQWLQRLLLAIRTPILLGCTDEIVDQAPGEKKSNPTYFNAAAFARPGAPLGPLYHKLHLVPFGEYIPFEQILPWMRFLTPISVNMSPGKQSVLFPFEKEHLGVLICFEDTFPSLARNLSLQGADVFVNLTNDAWFKTSPGAAMHAANAVMRCVETRRPMLRCTNHGLTLTISPYGQILDSFEPFQTGYKCTNLTLDPDKPMTFYTLHGDWFAYACMGPVVFGLIFLLRYRKQTSKP